MENLLFLGVPILKHIRVTLGKYDRVLGKIKVSQSYSLIAVGAMGVRVPLYLGHSK